MRTVRQHPHLTRRAWFAAAFIPVGFVVSMVVGEGLLTLQGYESTDEHVPAGAVALAGGAGITVFVIPCVVTWILGRRAVASGEPQGQVPAIVAAAVGAGFVVLNLVGVVGRLAGL
ncbi:hypothetical protein ABT304_07580 [Nocardioides sp. NPDC000445]|uniref:hypothetical protein n=1 Tax=Nocardioides sp. NPDC000445 TaxID=3154257 RepID=UPI0033258B3C